jgi:hypothetical protein
VVAIVKGKPVPFARRPGARIWWDQGGTGDPVLLIMGHAYTTDAARAASQEVLRFLAGIPGPAGGSGTSTRPATSTADT